MAFYEWTERLAVGIASIDRQHKTLIGYINTLAEAMHDNKGIPPVVLGLVLDNLVTYTKMHFIYEEMLFDRYGYQEAEDHKKHHKKLIMQVAEYCERFKKGDNDFGKELLEFLMWWLNHHILIDDVAYSAFLAQQGCK
jgi:hemerythrin